MQAIAHYNILERLGTGALGEVFRARDLKVGRTVALMQPPADLIHAPEDRSRFLADARAAMALNHPNIATLFDVVEQDGRCYLAYEFAAGPSLHDEMGGRAVNARRAVEIAAQIADALAEGHSRGLVHGDLRPENVVVTPKGSVKILNFGLTRWTTGGRARASASTKDGLGADPVGVAAYLSPEQAIGSAIDARSDVFSLGAVLHEMLSGRPPFRGDTPAATVTNVIRMPAPGLSSSIPPDLGALVTRALSKSIEGRPQDALSVSSELRRVANALDVRSGHAAPTELIPVAAKKSSSGWIAAVIVISLAAIVWWFVF
ncbi:MAG TPA: serine/threonine-protein kinase [Vicinamibacterales bacterium]|jgi:serine/threonine-protein kinase